MSTTLLDLPDELIIDILNSLTDQDEVYPVQEQAVQSRYLETSTRQPVKPKRHLLPIALSCKQLFSISMHLIYKNVEVKQDSFGQWSPPLHLLDSDRQNLYREPIRHLTLNLSSPVSFMDLERWMEFARNCPDIVSFSIYSDANFVTQHLSEYDVEAFTTPESPNLRKFVLTGRWTMETPNTLPKLLSRLNDLNHLQLSLVVPKQDDDREDLISTRSAGKENLARDLVILSPDTLPVNSLPQLSRLELSLGDTDDIHALNTIGIHHLLKTIGSTLKDLRLAFFTPRRSMVEHVNFSANNLGGLVSMETLSLPHDSVEVDIPRLLEPPKLVKKVKDLSVDGLKEVMKEQSQRLAEYTVDEALPPTVDLLMPIGWVLVNQRTIPLSSMIVQECKHLKTLHLSLPDLSDIHLFMLIHGTPSTNGYSPSIPFKMLTEASPLCNLTSLRLTGGGTAGTRGITDLGVYLILANLPQLSHLVLTFLDISHITLRLIRHCSPTTLSNVTIRGYGGLQLEHFLILAGPWGKTGERIVTFRPELLPLDLLRASDRRLNIRRVVSSLANHKVTLKLAGFLERE